LARLCGTTEQAPDKSRFTSRSPPSAAKAALIQQLFRTG
jgi:hypothetical protein